MASTREEPAIGSAKARESFSQLVARILDQLSLSAWLPSAALVAALVLLVNLRKAEGSYTEAFTKITQFGLPEILLTTAAVIVGTLITQAFEFEAIRALEGYWGPGRRSHSFARWRCQRHVKKRVTLSNRRDAAMVAAFAPAEVRMCQSNIFAHFVGIIKGDVFGYDTGATEDELGQARQVPWQQYGDAAQIRLVEMIDERLRSSPPAEHRAMPTRLGNTLRAYEDRTIDGSNEALESWVLRRFAKLPVALQYQHDQERSRLDVYCSMVFVGVMVGIASVPALWTYGPRTPLIFIGIVAASTWLSYRAAVASGRAYGTTLEAIRSWEDDQVVD